VFLALLAGCVLFGTLAILIREVRRSEAPRWVGPTLASVVVLAGLLRMFWARWGFIHEYFHAGGMTAAYLFSDLLDFHGEVAPSLYRAMQAVTDGHEDAIFGTNALLGTMTVPALALLDLMLSGSWIRAVFSAFVLAVLPHHVRLSGTEDFFVAAVLFSVCGLGMGVRYLRTGSRAALGLAVGGLFLAMESRPEGALTPVLLGVLALMGADHGWWRAFARPATWAGVAGLGALVAMQRTWFPTGAETLLSDITFLRWPWPQLYLDPEVTPPVLPVLGAFGLLAAVVRRDLVALWPLVAAVGSVYASLIFFDNPTYNLRAQLIAVPYFVLFSAAGAQVLWGRTRPLRSARWIAGGICALLAYGTWSRTDFIHRQTPDDRVYRFVQKTVPRLPEGPRVTLLASLHLTPFPAELVWRERKWIRVVALERWAEGLERGVGCSNLIVFEGPGCFFAASIRRSDEEMDPRCLAVRRACHLEPLFGMTLELPDDYGQERHGGRTGPVSIGFYRATGPAEEVPRE